MTKIILPLIVAVAMIGGIGLIDNAYAQFSPLTGIVHEWSHVKDTSEFNILAFFDDPVTDTHHLVWALALFGGDRMPDAIIFSEIGNPANKLRVSDVGFDGSPVLEDRHVAVDIPDNMVKSTFLGDCVEMKLVWSSGLTNGVSMYWVCVN